MEFASQTLDGHLESLSGSRSLRLPLIPGEALKKILLVIAGLFAMLVSCGVGAAAGGSEDTPASTAAEPTATETVTVTETADPEPASGSGAGITDGTYLVGSEIAPGVYESGGAEDGLCYA